MNRENYKSLLKELNKFGFDNRVNELLETCIRQCKPKFSFSYGTQPFLRDFEEEWLIYELHFNRNIWNGTYIFVKCDAQLFMPIDIPHREIFGIQTDLIEQKLLNLGSYIPYAKRTREEHLKIDAIGESLSIIGSDEQGKRIAELLITKYWPVFEDSGQVEAIKDLFYDKDTNLYYLSHTIHPSDVNRLTDIEDMMKEKVDRLIPKPPAQSYSIEGNGVKFSPESQIEISFKKQFYSLQEACSFLHSIDDILFNRKFMADNDAPWYLRKMTIIDNNDHQPVVTKLLQDGPNAINKTTELFILYELHDKKLSLSEFIQHRFGKSAPGGDLSLLLPDLIKMFTAIDPAGNTNQTVTGEENRHTRHHIVKKGLPPGRKL